MADAKITALSAVTEITDSDLLPIVADMTTTPATKKVTASNLLDGWIMSPAWAYASASTFTISGDYTSVYKLGVRLRWTQTSVKYGVVVSSSYSAPNTTVTIAVNTDYVVANAAITAQAYSFHTDPIGWPGWFAFTPSFTGVTVGDGTLTGKYCVIDKSLFLGVTLVFGSTTAVTGATTMALPINAVTANGNGSMRFFDASVGGVPGSWFLSSTSALGIRAINAAGTYVAEVALSSTVPFMWVATDQIMLYANYRLV